MLARIYSPVKNAMQSGKVGCNRWLLVYCPQKPKIVEPFMLYTSSTDMLGQIKIGFDSCEDAIAYAERENIPYRVECKHVAKRQTICYGDNFAAKRVLPWTH